MDSMGTDSMGTDQRTSVEPRPASDWTVAELQAEIGRLQSILHYKVLGDPRVSVTVSARPWVPHT